MLRSRRFDPAAEESVDAPARIPERGTELREGLLVRVAKTALEMMRRFEEHQKWTSTRLDELHARLQLLEARLDADGPREPVRVPGPAQEVPSATPAQTGAPRQRTKEGLDRQELVALRATKARARRAARLKARHESKRQAGEALDGPAQ